MLAAWLHICIIIGLSGLTGTVGLVYCIYYILRNSIINANKTE